MNQIEYCMDIWTVRDDGKRVYPYKGLNGPKKGFYSVNFTNDNTRFEGLTEKELVDAVRGGRFSERGRIRMLPLDAEPGAKGNAYKPRYYRGKLIAKFGARAVASVTSREPALPEEVSADSSYPAGVVRASAFHERYNLLPDGRRIWMIQAVASVWHWDKLLDEKPCRCDWGGDRNIKSKASRNRILNEVKRADIAFCYQAAPDKKLLGVARLFCGGHQRRGRGLIFDLAWWMRVRPLAYDVIKEDDVLVNSEKVKVGQGTLFRVSPKEAKRLLSLIGLSSFELRMIAKELRLPHNLLPSFREQTDCIDIAEPPRRIKTEITRIIRDTAMTSAVKHSNSFRCIICGQRLVKGDGCPYAEAHHLQPLGGNHHGPDIKANVIVLCPNHHAEFDFGAIAINPQSGKIDHLDPNDQWQGLCPRGEMSGGAKRYLEYHFHRVFKRKRVPR